MACCMETVVFAPRSDPICSSLALEIFIIMAIRKHRACLQACSLPVSRFIDLIYRDIHKGFLGPVLYYLRKCIMHHVENDIPKLAKYVKASLAIRWGARHGRLV